MAWSNSINPLCRIPRSLLRLYSECVRMSEHIHKHHNVSVLICHLVCPAKYRKIVFDENVGEEIKRICLEISQRFEIRFLEIGTDKDHVHFLVQSVPMYNPTKIAQTIQKD